MKVHLLSRLAPLLAGVAMVGSTAVAQSGQLHGVLYELEAGTQRLRRESPVWVDADTALGPYRIHRKAFGQYFPRMVEAQLQAGDARNDTGECRRNRKIGGGPTSYSTVASFFGASKAVVVGVIESKTVGFLYGKLSTYYGLRVEQALKTPQNLDLVGKVIYAPHGTVSIKVGGSEACYKDFSYPLEPAVGRRAALGLVVSPQEFGHLFEGRLTGVYLFGPVDMQGEFWFETLEGTAFMPGLQDVVDPPTWEFVERRLLRARDGKSGG